MEDCDGVQVIFSLAIQIKKRPGVKANNLPEKTAHNMEIES
jgi:hypothetical protein